MSGKSERDSLGQYSRFADALIDAASKDELALCARLLALGLARYRATYGELPEVESLLFRGPEGGGATDADAFADGMKKLVSTLASVSRSTSERSAV